MSMSALDVYVAWGRVGTLRLSSSAVHEHPAFWTLHVEALTDTYPELLMKVDYGQHFVGWRCKKRMNISTEMEQSMKKNGEVISVLVSSIEIIARKTSSFYCVVWIASFKLKPIFPPEFILCLNNITVKNIHVSI